MSESSTKTTTTTTTTSSSSSSSSTKPAPFHLTTEQIQTFHQDGVIVIRGLLHGEMLQNAIEAVKAFHIDPSFQGLYRNLKVQNFQTQEVFRRVALESSAPTICAKLMGLEDDDDVGEEKEEHSDTTQQHTHDEEDRSGNNSRRSSTHRSLRLLKDGIFGYSRGDKGCGWHVDDKFFWPCEDIHNDNDDNDHDSSSTQSTTIPQPQPPPPQKRRKDAGINVWITLSPLTATEGGGLAVAPKTHDITDHNGPIGRLTRRARKMIATQGGLTTCELQRLAPDDHDRLESIKRVYDLDPGDAIVHDRYVFHRADPFRVDEHNHHNETKKDETKDRNTDAPNEKDGDGDGDDDGTSPKFRISLRYMPSDATFFNTGRGSEPAVTQKQLQTGDPLWKAGECFPQVWPYTLEEEVRAFS